MFKIIYFFFSIHLASLVLSLKYSITFTPKSSNQFDNFIFINEICYDEIFDKDLRHTDAPKLVIRCTEGKEHYEYLPQGPSQFPRFGPHRYTHIFYKANSDQIITLWKQIYSGLSLTKFKSEFFNSVPTTYIKYPHYNGDNIKLDYWRSQWNQDKFIVKDSHALIYKNLEDHNHQLPTNLQNLVKPEPEPEAFAALFFSPISGSGGVCKHSNLIEQLQALTLSFNAYDMLFCDIFTFYNLSFQTNYDFNNFRWMSSFVIRDDLISSFPPDSNSVFYASTGITFITLKDDYPVVWNNILRPFTYLAWVCIIALLLFGFGFTEILSWVEARFRNPGNYNEFLMSNPNSIQEIDAKRIWSVFTKIARTILCAAYSGMILVGMLHPSYPWSPKTFKELNNTRNFICATAFHSAVFPHQLKVTYTLNGIPEEKWRDRDIVRENRPTPGSYLIDDELDESHRYAMFMYDDKKDNYIYGRKDLQRTGPYLHRLETNKESVLHETRYISTSPGATKLHFLIDAIRRCFETGCWMKWKKLEVNYFKHIAPNLVSKFGADLPVAKRSLNIEDIYSVIYILGLGLFVSCLKCFLEIMTNCSGNRIRSTEVELL